jgi:hypothetical protein
MHLVSFTHVVGLFASLHAGDRAGHMSGTLGSRQALKSPHIVGLFCPYSRSLLTLVWSAQAGITARSCDETC